MDYFIGKRVFTILGKFWELILEFYKVKDYVLVRQAFWWICQVTLATKYTPINQMSDPKEQKCLSLSILQQRYVGQKLWFGLIIIKVNTSTWL